MGDINKEYGVNCDDFIEGLSLFYLDFEIRKGFLKNLMLNELKEKKD